MAVIMNQKYISSINDIKHVDVTLKGQVMYKRPTNFCSVKHFIKISDTFGHFCKNLDAFGHFMAVKRR